MASPDGPDDSSIKPVSSLLSRFENLGKAQDSAPPSKSTSRQNSLNADSSLSGHRPVTPAGESGTTRNGLGAQILHSSKGPVPLPEPQKSPRVFDGVALPVPGNGRPNQPRSRPLSMISLPPPEPSPPAVTVESPRSPRHTIYFDTRPSEAKTPLQPYTPNSRGGSPSSGHVRALSRGATPALETHMTSFRPNAEISLSTSPGHRSPVRTAAPDTLVPKKTVTQPPQVNRAAKPRIPAKPAALAQKPSGLAAPEQSADLTDRSASPFSTPPGSCPSSPVPRRDSSPRRLNGLQRPRKESDLVSVRRDRTSSDASWVQRIRGDSEASTLGHTRTGSEASLVDLSPSRDEWLPPPTHHAAATMRHQMNGRPRAPAGYRRAQGNGSSDLDDPLEERPRLPVRPESQAQYGRRSPPKPRSGRSSPLKTQYLPPKRSMDSLPKINTRTEPIPSSRVPSLEVTPRSALSQGFDRSSPIATPGPPMAPAPRRSMDRRRDLPPPIPAPTTKLPIANERSGNVVTDPFPVEVATEQLGEAIGFPDATQSNRRPPKLKQRPHQIPTGYDTRLFAVCGEYVCTTGYLTKVWNMRTGEGVLSMEHRENTKVLSVVFKPMPDLHDEGKRLWLGTTVGEIHEIDIPSQSVVQTKANAHNRREIIRLMRCGREVWSLDDGGELNVWRAGQNNALGLDAHFTTWRVPRGHSFSLMCGKHLWMATGKDVRVFLPGARSDMEFQALRSPLSQPGTGDVTAGAVLHGVRNLVHLGHSDGKVSIYNPDNFSCVAVVSVSLYKISSLAAVGDYLWAGYSTGMAYVYDTSTTPWTVKKEWQAHDKQVCSIIADPSALGTMGRFNVVTLGLDNQLRVWDGLLEEDWLQTQMHGRDSAFCSYREISAAVLTWNAGASKPSSLQHSFEDNNFFRDYVVAQGSPDIFVFGFQELVDLEDKKVTAKSLFKSKKKDPNEQEHMSHQYRAWRDHLTRCIDESLPVSQKYTLLNTASMVGLFTCIFVKSSERARIRSVHTSEIKRGMGGRYGNKGALVLRMVLDDSSLCLINCHLAAGQTQTMHRNNDVAAILEAQSLPSFPLANSEGAPLHGDVFAAGGDGSMILDHEICILNGDLNYRIDTMGRDAVVRQVQQGNLAKLLERDQLLLSRKKNPGFRLRAFQESPITFAPTYKYNVRTDDYDTSEKRRAPAWCDRILYRGIGKVKMEDYRRWDQIRVSDHRPVSGRLRIRVKSVHAAQRDEAWQKCLGEFDAVRARITHAAQ